MVNLTGLERLFFAAAWEIEAEREAEAWEAMTGGE